MKLQTLADVEQALKKYIPDVRALHANYDLTRLRQFMSLLGNPQDVCRAIHIAGTSGKTSTAYFISALLVGAGQKVGLTVSPHIISLTERLQINGRPVSDKAFVSAMNQFLPLVEAGGITLTYFELMIAFVYWYFAQQDLDYVVIETGLGGLLDGTNTISRQDKICVISDIGYDHTTVLGKTIEEIAFQKAGIILPGNKVFSIQQSYKALAVIHSQAAKRHADITVVRSRKHIVKLPLFQQRNWSLARAVYLYLKQHNHLPSLSIKRQQEIAGLAQPPGRMEEFIIAGKRIILDGAHNPQKLHALRRALLAEGIERVAVLANFVKSHDTKIQACLRELKPLASCLIVPEFTREQDLLGRSMAPDIIATKAELLGIPQVSTALTAEEGLRTVLARPERTLLITGSLFLVRQVRFLLKEQRCAANLQEHS